MKQRIDKIEKSMNFNSRKAIVRPTDEEMEQALNSEDPKVLENVSWDLSDLSDEMLAKLENFHKKQ